MAQSDGNLRGALERVLREIAATDCIEDLVREVTRFMTGLASAERASLPAGFRPSRILTQDDIAHWADRMRQPGSVDGAASSAVRDMFHFASWQAQHLRPRRTNPRYVR
jgi:hypothetical protein